MTSLAKAAVGAGTNLAGQFESLFRDFNHPNAPGASVLVIREGKTLFARGFGLADLERKTPCTTNTNFRLASVTKPFTAMAVLILADRGKLSLDERLPAFFPEFPEWGRDITVHHLLTHTSGLMDYEDAIPSGTTLPVLDRDVLRILLKQEKPAFRPGSRFHYSNSGYAVLALIVEARSGQTFARFLKENIFDPLKMTGTLAYEQGSSVVPNRAFGYTVKRDSLAPSDGERARARGSNFERTDQSLTSSVLGDGGIYSSVADLFKWDQALYKTKLVSEGTVRVAFTPATATDKPERSYGLGWFIGEYRGLKEIWHSGNTVGFTTRIARFPGKKFSIIILANRTGAALDELPHRIADLVLFSTAPGAGS